MKKFFIFAMATLLAACSDEQTGVDRASDKEEAFPVTEARAFVESLMTQRTRGEAEEESFFIHGDFICDWDAAQFSSGRVQYSQDVAIASDYDYFRYHVDSTGKPFLTPIYHKLVVIEEQETGLQGAFVRYYVPDPAHALSHDAAYYDALLNSNRKTDFTGYSLYTDLDGWVVTVGYYSEGDLMQYASFADQQYSAEENMERMEELLGVMAVARKPHQAATRGSDTGEEPLIKVDIEGVETVGWRHEKDWSHILYMLSLLEDTQPKIKKEDQTTGGGGGGPTGSVGEQPTDDDPDKPGDPNAYDKNPHLNIGDDKDLGKLLDKLLKDCMGQVLVGSIDVDVQFVQEDYWASDAFKNGVYVVHYNGNDSDDSGFYADYLLMEELIHVHQRVLHGDSFVHANQLNMEIEAKTLWVLYLQRDGSLSLPETEAEVLGALGSLTPYALLGEGVQTNNYSSAIYLGAYDVAGQILHSCSSIYSHYSYNSNNKTMETAKKLMKDC